MGATEIWLVRHGESVANIATVAAHRAGRETIESDGRDADVPLSVLGERQAEALGGWMADNIADGTLAAVWSSPFLRAEHTLSLAIRSTTITVPVQLDERLRDRDRGAFELLTSHGISARYPDESARLDRLGKFYFRPPGGESWADIALRVRSFLRDVDHAADRPAGGGAAGTGIVLVASHDAVVMVFLYVCLGLTEQDLLSFAEENDVANASVTRLSRPSGTGGWTMDVFSHDDHLDDLDALNSTATTETVA